MIRTTGEVSSWLVSRSFQRDDGYVLPPGESRSPAQPSFRSAVGRRAVVLGQFVPVSFGLRRRESGVGLMSRLRTLAMRRSPLRREFVAQASCEHRFEAEFGIGHTS